jgi:hypothetical protein
LFHYKRGELASSSSTNNKILFVGGLSNTGLSNIVDIIEIPLLIYQSSTLVSLSQNDTTTTNSTIGLYHPHCCLCWNCLKCLEIVCLFDLCCWHTHTNVSIFSSWICLLILNFNIFWIGGIYIWEQYFRWENCTICTECLMYISYLTNFSKFVDWFSCFWSGFIIDWSKRHCVDCHSPKKTKIRNIYYFNISNSTNLTE